MRRLAVPLVLLGLLLGSIWLAWLRPDESLTAIDRSGQPLADYRLSGLTLRQYDPEGLLSRRLVATKAVHVPGRGTDLEKPRLTLYTRDGAPWQISGARGLIDPGGEQLTLPEDVLAERHASSTNRSIRLTTSNLHYDMSKGFARTDEPVTVTSERDRIDAVGMDAWLQDPGRIHFKSQVRGHYVP